MSSARLKWAEMVRELIDAYPVVDCAAAPSVPDGLSIVIHRAGGRLNVLDLAEIDLFYAGLGNGHRVLSDLEDQGKAPVNVCVLDFFLDHPELVPDDWDEVLFFGTIYKDANENLIVRGLKKEGENVVSKLYFLDSDWYMNAIAVEGE